MSKDAVEECLATLAAENIGTIKSDEPLARYTTVHIGGKTPALIEVNSDTEAACLLKCLHDNGVSYRFLSAGSNVLIPDDDLSFLVIKAGKAFRRMSYEESYFHVGAAMPLMRMARECSAAGFSGLEFGAGIPALLGGAVTMNAGAHGGELASVLQALHLAHPDGSHAWYDIATFDISYRHTALPDGCMVLGARLKLAEGDKQRSEALLKKNLQYRKDTQPLTLPSFGSVFKNPEADHAARLIEASQLKGSSCGGAEISSMHANWIVNPDRTASFDDVRMLMKRCQDAVYEKQGVNLEAEVDCWNS